MLKIPAEYDRDTSPTKLTDFFATFLHASLLDVSAVIFHCQRALVKEPGMTTIQMGTHNISENGRSAWVALYDTDP
jgi:hypothetical protein